MAGPINWLSQVGSITKFGLMSIPQRRGAATATIIGIALAIMVHSFGTLLTNLLYFDLRARENAPVA